MIMRADGPKVAILGAGLSSGYALLAAQDYGCSQVVMYSDALGFPPLIAHLRWAPDRLGLKRHPILRVGMGDRETYMRKLSRPRWDVRTNYPTKSEIEYGINPLDFYHKIYPPEYVFARRGDGKLKDEDILDIAKGYDYVFLSFPTQEALKRQPPYRLYTMLISEQRFETFPNMIVYNGIMGIDWTRFSMMWGYITWEFAQDFTPSTFIKTGFKELVLKDFGLGTNPYIVTPAPNIYPIGRWARWDKKALSHEVYDYVYDILFTGGI